MTSLYPGMLFYSSGLNKKSTPYGPEVTPSEIEEKLGRVPFNGRPWPKSSPISHVYDVRNSSTRMIILNNKLSKRPKGSRLRGQSDFQGEIQHPEPFRHATEDSHTNWEHHKRCTSSVTEKFVPVYPRTRGVSPLPEWVNKTQRPAMKFDNGSGVNPNHHIQCQGQDYDIVRWYNAHRKPRAQSRSSSVRDNRAMSPILNDPNLSKGERRYLNSIAKIYSVDNMRVQKQHQYTQLMFQEMSKGISREADWNKYLRYLNTPRKTQFGPCDPNRSASAAGRRSRKDGDEVQRPHTTQTGARSVRSSHGLSTAGSTGNKSQNEKSKKGGGNQRPVLKGRDNGKKNEDLTGRPAPAESPLPDVPRKDSVGSLSSLSSNGDKKDTEDRHGKSKESSTEERGKRDITEIEKEEKGNDKVTDIKNEDARKEEELENVSDDKRKEEDEDERSKLSARDDMVRSEDDHPARGVEYVPVYGERQGEEESERSMEATNTSQKQGAKPGETSPKSPVANEARKEDQMENSVVFLPPAKESPSGNTKGQDNDKNDDFENGPELRHHQHKEGGDRPLSRLGGRGQFTRTKKGDADNSDDDYSDDGENDHKESMERNNQEIDEATDQPRGDHSTNQQQKSDKNGRDDANVRLSLHHDKDDKNDTRTGNKDSPTEASSQEKHSTISSLEY